MKAFDNANLTDKLCGNCGCPGFAPAIGYAYNASAKTVTLTEKGTAPSSDTFKNANVEIHDRFGNSVKSSITAAAGNTGALDVSGLNASKGLRVTATVVTNGGCTSDGSTDLNAAAGDLANWDKDFSSAEALA